MIKSFKGIAVVLAVVLCLGLSGLSFGTNQISFETVACSVKVSKEKSISVRGVALTKEAAEVIEKTNMERALAGLSTLEADETLMAAAQLRSFEINVNWSHDRPDGSKWSTVCDNASGENIAFGQSSGEDVVTSWMGSSGHKTNILTSKFAKIGVGAVEIDGVVYWTQLFGY